MHRYAERFDHKIYGIETGSTWNTQVNQAIGAGKFNLKDWQVVGSSTAAMLAQVKRTTQRKKWIVFYGWKPHWMNIAHDLYYLKGPKNSPIVHTEATVYTLVASNFKKAHLNPARFFRQYQVDSKIQSQWVYRYSYQKRPLDEVSTQWIKSHMQLVGKWLKGVETKDGKPAFAAVKAAYAG